MHAKYLILPAIFLASCGNAGELTSTPDPQKPAQTAPIVQAAIEFTPMERGEKLYKRCRACHTLEEGAKHKVGPNLWGIYGKKAGSQDGFKYSKVMAASEIIWDDTTLDGYITKPSTFMKGNRMSFVGVKKAEDREDLLLYLKAKTTPAQ